MSRFFRRPEFRLQLGYPHVVLTRVGRSEPIGTAAPDSPGFRTELARLAAEVTQARGSLTAVLPPDEVWRGRLALPGTTRLAHRRAARDAVASRLGTPAGAIVVAVGKTDAQGLTPVAGVTRATLAETRLLLDGVGLRPAKTVGAGDFPGFAAPPDLGAEAWRHGVPSLTPRRVAALGAGAAAAVALAVLSMPSPPPAPVVLPTHSPLAAAAPDAFAPVPQRPAATAAPKAPRELALLRSERPTPRPERAADEPEVTVATRSVPLLWTEPPQGGARELKLAELTTARARMIDATAAVPVRRPVAAPVAAVAPAAAAPKVAPGGPRPMPRPDVAAAVELAPALPDGPLSAASGRPRHRPAEPAVVKVAALAPPAIAAADLTAALAAPPPARPAGLRSAPAPVAAKPAAKPAVKVVAPAKPAPKVVSPVKPTVQRQAAAPVRQAPVAVAPQRVVTVAPRKPVAVAAQAPRQAAPTVRRAPQAVVRAAPAPTAKPVRNASATFAAERTGISRGNVSLIGVFGGADGRHALLRLPNGDIRKVAAGDSVQGVRVAAVGPDTVQLLSRGRNTLLRLPD